MALRARGAFLIGLLFAASLAVAQPTRPLRGRSVQSVIDELRAAGAPLVYSSNLLSRGLTVQSEPSTTAPLAMAREILRPHGLDVREEAGVWLVVRGEPPPAPAPAPGRVVLQAQAAYAGSAIADFTVEIDPPNGASVASVSGVVELGDLAAGRHALTVRAQGFLPAAFERRGRCRC